ncbi:MAG: DUF1501 domain-containing protein [Planctomycetota bacterium]|nr:DUF1501 domain-containing protein [Planctomycetota bacterium]
MNSQNAGISKVVKQFSRRNMLAATASLGGLALPSFLRLRSASAETITANRGRAKACIIIYAWGGMSHHETWDPKPDAPAEFRGEFNPIETATPGIQIGEHMPHLARQTDKLAIIRSIHHDDSAHGRGMYWNLTGHKPPRVGNIPPMRNDWPSLPAVVSKFSPPLRGVPSAVRLPYPMVDNGTLQAGEYGGWLGAKYDPIVIRTPSGEPFGGVSRSLGSQVLNLGEVDFERVAARNRLRASLERPLSTKNDFESFQHFRSLANDILLSSAVKDAYDLDKEDPKIRESYGNHIGGQSILLARRLTEAGVPIVQVCCAAGDLNGAQGDMWDTHGDNFNRLKNRLLPVFDVGTAALLQDLSDRGTLDDTLVLVLTDFGRTPRINPGAGRDHYPNVYSIALAGGGIQGGQVYGSSDATGAFPETQACGPPDVHATIFRCLGISPRAEIRDMLGRPFPVSDGNVLPLL